MVNGNSSRNMTDREMLIEFRGVVKTEISHLNIDIADIKSSMKDMNNKMDEHLEQMNKVVSNCRSDSRQDNLTRDERIKDLENWKNKVHGALSIIGFVGISAWGRLLRMI